MKLKKSYYKNYAAESEYFDDKEILNQEIQSVENTKKYFTWVQEFSKKIVFAIFVIYVITAIFMLAMVFLSYQQGNISGIDTLITETNETFRQIVGGYIIKSAIENAVKIGGNYFVGVSDAKLRAMKARLEEQNIIKDDGKGLNDIDSSDDSSDEDIDSEDTSEDEGEDSEN